MRLKQENSQHNWL